MSESNPPVTYQLKIVLVGISPMIWRRIKVSSDSTIADLHYIIQIVMGWKEEHLHQFLIHGVHYGINYPGTGGFMGNAHEIRLSKFSFREREKFSYEYDFFSNWKHQIRVEAVLPEESERVLPVCTAGKGNCPPENCGGAIGFIRLRQQHSRFKLAVRMGERIASSFVESTVNQVVSKRFVKKQQMRWSKKGAHLLLQVRNLVINQELRQRINSWYEQSMPPAKKLVQKEPI